MDNINNKIPQKHSSTMDAIGYAKDKVGTDPKLRTAGCVAVGLATAAAAPYVVPPAITAVGFTKLGIAAGSTAASIMSATGTLGLGMSVLSSMQSIGAAGLGIKGAVVAGLLGYKAAEKISRGSQEPVIKSKL